MLFDILKHYDFESLVSKKLAKNERSLLFSICGYYRLILIYNYRYIHCSYDHHYSYTKCTSNQLSIKIIIIKKKPTNQTIIDIIKDCLVKL